MKKSMLPRIVGLCCVVSLFGGCRALGYEPPMFSPIVEFLLQFCWPWGAIVVGILILFAIFKD